MRAATAAALPLLAFATLANGAIPPAPDNLAETCSTVNWECMVECFNVQFECSREFEPNCLGYAPCQVLTTATCDVSEDALAAVPAPRTCVQHDGLERCWFTYDASGGKPAPLVVDLHAFSFCATNMSAYSGWREKAEDEGFIVVWPQGAFDLSGYDDKVSGWNAGGCCGSPMEAGLDDVGFLVKVIEATAQAHTVDESRVYAAGHSVGCMMAQQLALQASDRIAAVACHAGYIATQDIPERRAPTPAMVLYGKEDMVLPYEPMAPLSLQTWAAINGCPGPEMTTASPDGYIEHKYAGCKGDSTVALIEVTNGGHVVYSGAGRRGIGLTVPDDVFMTTVNTTDLAWDFVRQYKLSCPAGCISTYDPATRRGLLFSSAVVDACPKGCMALR